MRSPADRIDVWPGVNSKIIRTQQVQLASGRLPISDVVVDDEEEQRMFYK